MQLWREREREIEIEREQSYNFILIILGMMAEASIGDSYVVDGQLANLDQGSDQVIDRWCETCYDDTRTKIGVNGFCS